MSAFLRGEGGRKFVENGVEMVEYQVDEIPLMDGDVAYSDLYDAYGSFMQRVPLKAMSDQQQPRAPIVIDDQGHHPFDDILTHDDKVALVILACERYDSQVRRGPRAMTAFASLVAGCDPL
jgi:hypothetical protein